MTIRNALLALGALFAGNALAASSFFSIYFNGESQTANCHVDYVSNAQLSTTGSGNLVATASTPLAFSSACGISGGGQQLTFGPAQPLVGPSAPLASGSNVTGNFSVLPLNAASCTVAFNPTTNVTGPAAGYVCGSSGSQSCTSPTPISFSASFTNTGSSTASWQATVNCAAAAGASPASLASNSVTVSQSGAGTGGGTSCTTGTTGDVAGYTAICSGDMYKGPPIPQNKLGPSAYTFPFVFGSAWPGSYAGFPLVFTIAGTQFLSIPFTPTPGHTIGITENQTYTSYPITFSVSTSPGLFNNGTAGNGVLCAQTNNPTLQISSNSTATNCPNLNQGTQYWFNVIPAKYSTVQGQWLQSCTGSNCQLAIYMSNIN